jgi:hypothetical protein
VTQNVTHSVTTGACPCLHSNLILLPLFLVVAVVFPGVDDFAHFKSHSASQKNSPWIPQNWQNSRRRLRLTESVGIFTLEMEQICNMTMLICDFFGRRWEGDCTPQNSAKDKTFGSTRRQKASGRFEEIERATDSRR